MRSVMAVSKPWPEKLCGMPNIPNRKTSRVATMAANFQRRFLFIKIIKDKDSKTVPIVTVVAALLFGLSFLVGSSQLRHRGLGHFEPQVVRRNPQMDRVFLQSHHGPAQAAGGGYPVAGLDALQHGLPFLLPALLRHNHE